MPQDDLTISKAFGLDRDWIFTGQSGAEYRFTSFSRKALLPETGGIYIVAYTHPRGHLAGIHVNPLYMGITENLRQAACHMQQQECVVQECWNYTYILPFDGPVLKDKPQRNAIFQDIQSNTPTRC